MLDWIGDTFLWIVTSVPALFVAQDSPTFSLIRGMLGLILFVLVLYLIALLPFRPFLEALARPRLSFALCRRVPNQATSAALDQLTMVGRLSWQSPWLPQRAGA
jgi:uncharacterized membrane protein